MWLVYLASAVVAIIGGYAMIIFVFPFVLDP